MDAACWSASPRSCAFVIGTLLGVYAGWRRGTKADAAVTVGATLFAAFPPFWLGLLLLYVLAFKLNAFPIKGGYSAGPDARSSSLSFLATRSSTASCRR